MIKEIVDSYLDILDKDASEVQIKETKRAFLAGMVAWRSVNFNIVGKKVSIEIMETELAKAEQELFKEVTNVK